MKQNMPIYEKMYPLKVDKLGRFVIPADSKLREACRAGENLVAVEGKDGSFSIRRYEDVVREVQAYFKKRIPAGRSLVDELIAERRAEALRE